MKKAFTYLLLTFLCHAHAQQKAEVDALNNMPYDTKVAKSAVLDEAFLKNANDAHKIGYALGEADSYANLSLVYYIQGKYEKNFRYALKAVSLYEKLNAGEKMADAYGLMGYQMKRRNMKNALYYMQKGKRIAEQNGFRQPLLSIYNNYGVLKEMQEQYDSALYFYNKGLAIKEHINDSIGIPYSLNNIAGIHIIRKEFDKAKPMFDRAIAIRFRLKDTFGITENYTYFGDLYTAQHQPKQAIEWYNKSLEMAMRYRYTDLIQYSYKMLSENYESLHDQKLAFDNYKKYTQYKDSLLNKDTNSKIAELEVRFETNKKEKLIAQNRAELLQKEIEARKARYLIVGLALFALFFALMGYLLFRQQKLKNRQQEQEFQLKSAIAQIETQNQLQEQRLTISRDLHDNIGAQLTFIISSVDNIKYAFDIQNAKLDSKLQSISNFTKSTIVELRDTIWAMNSNEITFEDLRARILNFLEKAKSAKENIEFRFEIDDDLSQVEFTSIFGMNIYRTLQEAINNALKYANPTQINITVKKIDNTVSIQIQDNGIGFDMETVVRGNGLLNMEKRIESIGGIFTLHSEPEKGTSVSILIHL
ncbi:tetratricopeptide repeat protein [Flavobacterium sp.]|uniref:tetratricopeptide repeat protein n=1 Tax=Flavobacterium sp. TaxID=239 RepID=UPI00261323F5|nr:tetratricopeptide repeat protein [Flavobacterium sp.]